MVLIVFALWQIPDLGFFQYPFYLLGTWFHEMGHGLTASLLGGDFKYLEIYDNGGGVAYYTISESYLPVSLANALIAMGGLLGPAITGSLLIISAKTATKSKITLRALLILMVVSIIIWIRSFWGILILSSFVIVLTFITLIKNRKVEAVTLLFLGLQAVLSSYLQLDYLFTKQFERNGEIQISDTQVIASNTFGTYWLWGVAIIIISVFLIWQSFTYYLSEK